MTKRDYIERAERSLNARQRLKLFVFQGLFDRTQAVRSFRMACWRKVVQAGGMTEQESRHWLDLNARRPWWKCLSRFRFQADAGWWRAPVRHEEIDLQRLAGIGALLIKISDAFAGEDIAIAAEMEWLAVRDHAVEVEYDRTKRHP